MSEARSVIVGTAGHIDHGKTALVAALTGVDTDRLPEEKRRKITIDLGFAPWKIDKRHVASIVDVPGHEDFVRTMIAGAAGIDVVLLVVSSEDGIMPQTREHLAICELLGIREAVVALTKVDLFEGDEEAIELATEDVRDGLAGTPYAEAPILPCSAKAKDGLEDIRRAIRSALGRLPTRSSKGDVVLPVDRVFTMKGHGTVVTGTLQGGRLDAQRGGELRLVPVGESRDVRQLRVRGIEVRGDETRRSLAGTRTALNLAGVETTELSRGDVLTTGPSVERNDVIHVLVRRLPSEGGTPWRSGAALQICAGTASTPGTIDPLARLEDDALHAVEGLAVEPGAEVLLRVRLESPLPTWWGQRVVLRAFFDPDAAHRGLTVGGGFVVDPAPRKGRRQRARWIALADQLRSQDPRVRGLALVRDAGLYGVDDVELSRRGRIEDPSALLGASLAEGELLRVEGRWVAHEVAKPLVAQVIAAVDEFHRNNPMRPGGPRAAMEAVVPRQAAAGLSAWAVDQAIASGQLRVADASGALARPGKGKLDPEDLPAPIQAVYDAVVEGGATPPYWKEVARQTGQTLPQVIEAARALQGAELIIRVTDDLSWSTNAFEDILERVRQELSKHGQLDVATLKSQVGLTRKWVIPLLEYLDNRGYTRREGDVRVAGPKL